MRALLNLSKLNKQNKHKIASFYICLREKQANSFFPTVKKKMRQKNEVSQLLGASSKADPKFRRFLSWALSSALTFYFSNVFHKK